jgi:hypothetical protein
MTSDENTMVNVSSKFFCRCARCKTDLNVVEAKMDQHKHGHKDEGFLVIDLTVDPHLCTEYVDDNGTKMKQIKDHNDALQKRNTELVEENRRLKGVVGVA